MSAESPFLPPAQSQFQPRIATSQLDCVPCTARKCIRRATVDAQAPSTEAIRKASGISTRGLTYGEAAEAARKVSGVVLSPRYGLEREEVFDLADAGHGFGISIDCSVTVHTARATGSFTGDHTVYVQDVRHVKKGGTCRCEKGTATKAHNEYLIEDPGNSSKGYQWWSAGLVYRAAEERTRDAQGRSHGINVLLTPDTEGVKWRATGKGKVRKEPRVDAKAVASIVIGKVYPGGRTETGGPWKRADGTTGNGWVHVKYGIGRWGWINGRRVARA